MFTLYFFYFCNLHFVFFTLHFALYILHSAFQLKTWSAILPSNGFDVRERGTPRSQNSATCKDDKAKQMMCKMDDNAKQIMSKMYDMQNGWYAKWILRKGRWAKNDVLGWCTKKKEMSDKSTLCISLWGNLINGFKNVKKIWKGKLTGDNLSFHDVQRCGLGVLDLRWDTALVEYSNIHFKLYPKMIMLIHILVTHRAETPKIQRRKNHCTSLSLHCYHQDTWGDNLRRFGNRRSTWLLTMPWCLVQTT